MSLDAGRLAPQMIVLGLILERPDTMAGVQRRLGDEFEEAQFPKNTAAQALHRLVSKGWADEQYEGIFVGVEAGEARLVQWLEETALPPVIRDEMLGKLAFLGAYASPDAMLTQIATTKPELLRKIDSAHARYLTQLRLVSSVKQTREQELVTRFKMARAKYTASLIGAVASSSQSLARELEKLRADFPDIWPGGSG